MTRSALFLRSPVPASLLVAWLCASPLVPAPLVADLDAAARKARKTLAALVEARSNDHLKPCLEALAKAGGRENLEAILKVLAVVPESEDAIYWDLVQGISSFADRQALEHLGEALLRMRGTPRGRDLIFGLAKNHFPMVVFALAPALEKGAPDMKVMAAEKIGTILRRESVDALVAALKVEEKTDSELRDVLVEGLKTLTGQDFKTNVVNWEGWWQKNHEKPLMGPREPEEGRTTGTVVDKLDRKRAGGFEGLERSPKKAVIVLAAAYPDNVKGRKTDLNNGHIEQSLERMGIPHEVVKRTEFDKYDLRGVGAILINCAQFHEHCICPTCSPAGTEKNRLKQCSGCEKHQKFSARLSGAAIKKIREFVERGGYLFCEDWTVKEVVERTFPQYVSAGRVLREGTVDVVPARGRASHPLMKGIFSPEKPSPREVDDGDDWPGASPRGEGRGADPSGGGKAKEGKTGGLTSPRKPEPAPDAPEPELPAELVKVKHKWAIDNESWAIHIADPSKVVTLLTSGKLQKDTEGEGVVALCFRPGGDLPAEASSRRRQKGLVMQVLGHIGKQQSTEDEYTLQNLLVNFLIAANVARTEEELAKPKKKARQAPKKEEKKDPEET